MRVQRTSFGALRDAFLTYSTAQAREAESEAPKFNVFRILRIERDEVRLHSLLAHWLSGPSSEMKPR